MIFAPQRGAPFSYPPSFPEPINLGAAFDEPLVASVTSQIRHLAQTGKSLVVIQWGGGQVDDSALLSNARVNSIVWAGYAGQDGGPAILDVITGIWSIAARLPVTQYASFFTSAVEMTDMRLRPNDSYPGKTYKWYNGDPVLPFGHGLHYTNSHFLGHITQQPGNPFSPLFTKRQERTGRLQPGSQLNQMSRMFASPICSRTTGHALYVN